MHWRLQKPARDQSAMSTHRSSRCRHLQLSSCTRRQRTGLLGEILIGLEWVNEQAVRRAVDLHAGSPVEMAKRRRRHSTGAATRSTPVRRPAGACPCSMLACPCLSAYTGCLPMPPLQHAILSSSSAPPTTEPTTRLCQPVRWTVTPPATQH